MNETTFEFGVAKYDFSTALLAMKQGHYVAHGDDKYCITWDTEGNFEFRKNDRWFEKWAETFPEVLLEEDWVILEEELPDAEETEA
jgi:hypothetical protein